MTTGGYYASLAMEELRADLDETFATIEADGATAHDKHIAQVRLDLIGAELTRRGVFDKLSAS